MSATSGFSRMFLTRLRWVKGTSFGFSSRAMKIEARAKAKHTGTACGFPAMSAVARRATLWRTRKAAWSSLSTVGIILSRLYRVADARGDSGGEQAHVGQRLLVGDTG